MERSERIYVLSVLWPPANDHLSLSSEFLFVPIITIDKIGFLSAALWLWPLALNNGPTFTKAQLSQKSV